jgi:putative DNA primase/helicase
MPSLELKVSDRTEGTEGTQGTTHTGAESSSSPAGVIKGTERTIDIELESISPCETPPEEPPEPEIQRPSYKVYDDWFKIGESKKRPGLYWHGLKTIAGQQYPVDLWVCSPIHAIAITANEREESFGLLLRFMNAFGQWREWSMPMWLLKGSGEEMRHELLDLGVKMNLNAKTNLSAWLMEQKPATRITAATRTGWDSDGMVFVMPHKTIGDKNKVRFQSEFVIQNNFIEKGTLERWLDAVASKCKGNPILIFSLATAFAAPLLLKAKQQHSGGAGIHIMGKSSRGKTTALQVAASVWGSPNYVRTWRATANGLEATGVTLNDCLLILDEIGQSDPREIGAIVYAMANGQGKQRAKRTGGAQEAANWRVIVLSSGESTLSAHMQESGKKAKAGQEVRLLSIPVTDRAYGVFDELHGFVDGHSIADYLKQSTSACYGMAGPAFIKKLLEDKDSLPDLYARLCNRPEFKSSDSVESRAAGIFSLIAMAGEKATEYGLTRWQEGDALRAAIECFNIWRGSRGQGETETRQILDGIRQFVDRHGDSRFSELGHGRTGYAGDNVDQRPVVRDRAGYWKDAKQGRVFMFNSPALQEAAIGYDLSFILRTLQDAGWIAEHDYGKHSKKVRVDGRPSVLYWILPTDEGA